MFKSVSINISAILSTAALLSAVINIFSFTSASCLMISTNVFVFPVPKGPCIKKKCLLFKLLKTASRCDVFNSES